MAQMRVTYDLKEHIATLGKTGTTEKRLSFMSWNNAEPKIDIRVWRIADDGTATPGKGIALSESETAELLKALEQRQFKQNMQDAEGAER